ncbi:MAG: Fis family transcriptional regulator [Firmicutes bacterium]|nr:Fis family transcriptional regulator [Bacillota bacterium]
MKHIVLTCGQIAIVDDEDYEWLNKFKWHAQKHHTDGYYAVRNVRENGIRRKQYMHKLILGIDGTRTLGDHIDTNKLNNSRNNLRVASFSENRCNIGITNKNTTGYKGVYLDKRYNRFYARIKIGDKLSYLGTFSTAQEAAKNYNESALKHYGEFARINKID